MGDNEKPIQWADFEFLLDTALENFVFACRPLGDDSLIGMSMKVKEAFIMTGELIKYGLSNPEPPKDHVKMERYSEAIRAVVDFKASSKDSESLVANHLAAVKEAIIALGFMTVKPAPTQLVRDMIDASQYYATRVMVQHKGVEKHMLFITKFNELFSDLLHYVKKHFLTGFTWNVCKNARCAQGIPPPPPPPLLPSPPAGDAMQCGDGARIALLNQLNQGSNITRNLKPVNRDGDGPALGARSHGATTASSLGRPSPQKKVYEPKFGLDGKKWVIEHFKNKQDLIVNNENMSESVACYKLENCGLSVSNKVNNVVIDSCIRSEISLKSVISSVELIRCDRVQIKCFGVVPLINLENCESIQMFLSTESRNVEIISAKSSSCNVCLLEEDGNYRELPMQEQIKTVLQGGRLVSTVIEKN